MTCLLAADVGNTQTVLGLYEGAGVDLGEDADVPRRVRHDRRLPAGAGRCVNANRLVERDGERPERVGVAQLRLPRERELVERRLGVDPRDLLTPVRTVGFPEPADELGQPVPLELRAPFGLERLDLRLEQRSAPRRSAALRG